MTRNTEVTKFSSDYSVLCPCYGLKATLPLTEWSLMMCVTEPTLRVPASFPAREQDGPCLGELIQTTLNVCRNRMAQHLSFYLSSAVSTSFVNVPMRGGWTIRFP